MYLTKIDLDIQSRHVWRLLSDAYRMHVLLCKACGCDRQEGKVLYRIADVKHRPTLYVHSLVQLDEDTFSPGMHISAEREMTGWLANIAEGDNLRFSLIAVPSKKVKNDTSRNSRRVVLRDPEERRRWLEKQGTAKGVRFTAVREGPEKLTYVGKDSGQHAFNICGYEYSGRLLVTDTDAFREGIAGGVGPEKAFGYGLLLVTR